MPPAHPPHRSGVRPRGARFALALTLTLLGLTIGLGSARAAPLMSTSTSTSAWPDRLPEFTLGDGPNTLRLAFTGQLRFTFADPDVTEGAAGTERLTLQRIRPILVGRFLGGRLGFRLHLNTKPTTLELLDAYVDVRLSPSIRLRVGQQKIPFTRYRLNSFARLTLVDWSPAARAFGAERQIGFAIDGPLGGGFTYGAGVFSGANARSAFERGLAAAYGASLDNPSRLDDPAPPARVHPELVLRLSWQRGEDAFRSASDGRGGPPRLLAGLSAAWDARPIVARDFAVRFAPEVLFKAYGWSAGLVGYAGFFETWQGARRRLGVLGLTAQAAFRFWQRWEVSLRYARTQILAALRADAAAWADADPNRPSAPGLDHRQELALGFNVYLIGNQLEWQTDVGLLHAGPDGDPGIQVRSQLQLML